MNGPTTSEVNMISMADVMMNWRINPKLLSKDSNDSFKLEYFYSGLFNILLSTWCESVALLGGNGNNDKRHQNSSGLIRYIDITKCLKNIYTFFLFSTIDFTKKMFLLLPCTYHISVHLFYQLWKLS